MTDIIETNLTTAFSDFLNASTGDRIIMADGTYNNGSAIKSLTKNASGTVTFMAQNIGGAIITGYPITLPSANTVFQGFDLQYNDPTGSGSPYSPIKMTGDNIKFLRNKLNIVNASTNQIWISAQSTNGVIEYNEFYGKDTSNAVVVNDATSVTPTGCKIRYNWFRDQTGTVAAGETIRVGFSGHALRTFNAEISYNRLQNLNADPESITVKGSYVNVHHNHFINNNSSVSLRQCNFVTVENNRFDNCGLRMYGHDHVIRWNYFKNNSRNQLRQCMDMGNADVEEYPAEASNAFYARFKNNIIANNYIENGGSTTLNICQLGYDTSDNSHTPTGNIISNNTIIASTGKLTQQVFGALWSNNTVNSNLLIATGTATVGDMTSSGYKTQGDTRCCRIEPLQDVINLQFMGVGPFADV